MRTVPDIFVIAATPIVIGAGLVAGGVARECGYNDGIVFGVGYLSLGFAIGACFAVFVAFRGTVKS